jgi:hypothetical protein
MAHHPPVAGLRLESSMLAKELGNFRFNRLRQKSALSGA